MALASTQPVTEISARGKGGRCVGLKILLPSYDDFLEIVSLSLLDSSGLYRDCFTFTMTQEVRRHPLIL